MNRILLLYCIFNIICLFSITRRFIIENRRVIEQYKIFQEVLNLDPVPEVKFNEDETLKLEKFSSVINQ